MGNEIGRVCARNEHCVDYCVKLHTIANTIACKDVLMWTVSDKIVDGDANSYCQYTAAGRFLCYVIRFIGGHAALVT